VPVQPRVVCGTLARVQQGLAACGWQLTTACIARLNLSRRQPVAAVGRRVPPLGKHEAGLRQPLMLSQVYDHFCLPHTSWRQPLPTHGTGSAKRGQAQTPALAAGLTDHIWTRREGLLFWVPPWPPPAGL
jgi:hypothetical protein